MINTEYIKSCGKIYEVVGHDGEGRPVTVLTPLKEIPKDEPLPKPIEEPIEEKPKRRTRKKCIPGEI